jgi:hypothetical protein
MSTPEITGPYMKVSAILTSARTMLEEAIRQCAAIPDRKILVSQIDASIAQAKAARAQAIALFQQRQRDQAHALGMAGAYPAQVGTTHPSPLLTEPADDAAPTGVELSTRLLPAAE